MAGWIAFIHGKQTFVARQQSLDGGAEFHCVHRGEFRVMGWD
jgi:hypothetical protein